MTWLFAPFVAAAMAFLNRCRGDDTWKPEWLPGRALFWVSPVVGLIATALHGWELGLLFAVGYLAWGAPAWGYLQLLGRYVYDKHPTELESRLLDLASGDVHIALGLRHMFALPAFVGVALLTGVWTFVLWAPLFALAVVAAYETAWRTQPRAPIIIAEYAAGALWGVVIVVA